MVFHKPVTPFGLRWGVKSFNAIFKFLHECSIY
jgi:hypothetical protein